MPGESKSTVVSHGLPVEAARLIAERLAEPGQSCITCSFQAEDVALLHMLLQVNPEIPVLFLDTVHHFPQTYAYRDELAASWHLNLVNLRAAEPAPGLWRTSTDACCAKHKVEPLFSALEGYDLWFTGLRRQQSASRANRAEVEAQAPRAASRNARFGRWTTKTCGNTQGPRHPLLQVRVGIHQRHCEPCTSVPLDPDDPRSGRWSGQKLNAVFTSRRRKNQHDEHDLRGDLIAFMAAASSSTNP